MHSTALATAMTLYRSGTLTLSQAATRSGYSEKELTVALERHGIPVRESEQTVRATAVDSPASAD
ncbi:UPF0175 family protein [Haloferax namakaokahaiae]|uniref:UPF0175 family protein n=1 Tax=Haloferax namakaokahaiae TaxID=1748331 RepID=A0ABD5ZIE7_9EURY